MRQFSALCMVLTLAGCNAQDATTLGRIGAKLHQRVDNLLANEPNAKLITTLPLLQAPEQNGRGKPAVDPLMGEDRR